MTGTGEVPEIYPFHGEARQRRTRERRRPKNQNNFIESESFTPDGVP
jgi:hypothetical protein